MGKIEELIEKLEKVRSRSINKDFEDGYNEGIRYALELAKEYKSSLPTQQADGVKELIKKIDREMFAYPEMEPEQDDEATEDFKDGYNQASKVIIDYLNELPTKQDKVVVKQYIADWYEESKDELESNIWEHIKNHVTDFQNDFDRWMYQQPNSIETLIRMKDGYTVEKEQLYYVELPEKNTDTYNVYGLKKYSDGKINVGYYDKKDIGKSINSKLTEKEIKSVHENYWAFAVPVEEDE